MHNIGRRDFVSGAVATTAIAAVGALPASALAEGTAMLAAEGTLPAGTFAEDYAQSAVELEPITEFAAEESYDIVVVGAGDSGVVAVLTAADEGATGGCLQKEEKVSANGKGESAFIRGKSTPGGFARVESDWIKANNWRCNRELFDFYMDHAEETLSWLLQQSLAAGMEPSGYNTKNTICYPDGEIAASFAVSMPSNQEAMEALAAAAQEKGAVIHYSTPAVQLVQDESGRVTGAIGK
jgi:fumarate reductase flavoprotein subunit